jgi:hypothetical protein
VFDVTQPFVARVLERHADCARRGRHDAAHIGQQIAQRVFCHAFGQKAFRRASFAFPHAAEPDVALFAVGAANLRVPRRRALAVVLANVSRDAH